MVPKQDPDVLRSASHRHMIAHLTGPLGAGAVETIVPINTAGQVDVTKTSREPLLLVGPLAPLGERALRVVATFNPGGAAISLSLEFAPHTETGAFLPLLFPGLTVDAQAVLPFTVGLEVVEIAGDGVETTIPVVQIANHIEFRLVEGVMGRMIYMLGAEKQRLRRQAGELTAMRKLSLARDDALDRVGAELAVPRFSEEIKFVQEVDEPGEIITVIRKDANGIPIPEPDHEYRRRLALFRPRLMSNRSRVLQFLNGAGTQADRNGGPLGELGLNQRFRVVEDDNEFAVAIHLVASGDEAFRENFLSYIRRVHLVQPGIDVGDHRFLPSNTRQQENQLRARLRQFFRFPDGAAIASMLAVALDRVGRCRAALDVTRQVRVLRAQDATRGSRYELGLGVDVQPQTVSELNRMVERLLDPQRPTTEDPAIERLLRTMTPRPADEDPEGRWLLEACGLRTVHRINGSRIYLSHLPTFGLTITGPSIVEPGDQGQLEVRYHAPGDSGSNVVLVDGIETTATEWVASGGEAFTILAEVEARNRWEQAMPRPSADPALKVFRAAGLPAVETPESVVTSLKRLPAELVGTLRLALPQAQRILAGSSPAAITEAAGELRRLVGFLRAQGLASVLPLVTGPNEVVLVVSVIGLPEAGINLSERRATGFRWYVVPLQDKFLFQTGAVFSEELDNKEVSPGLRQLFKSNEILLSDNITVSVKAKHDEWLITDDESGRAYSIRRDGGKLGIFLGSGGAIKSVGSRTVFVPDGPGLSALVAIGYARRGRTDPYEFRVELPDDARLNLLQYEFLMNVLDHTHPLGVEVNTFSIRQRHVDLNGDGDAEPLPPTISKTYRQFRRPRYRGEMGVGIEGD